MASKRTQVTLDQGHKEMLERLQKSFEKSKRQPPSLAQLANRAIRKGLAEVIAEVAAELK